MEMEKQNVGRIATEKEGDRKVKYGSRYRKVPPHEIKASAEGELRCKSLILSLGARIG